MNWEAVLKAPPPQMPGGGDLQFGAAESSTHFEMDLNQLSSELNALDLDVQIINMSVGEIDPSITHIIRDAEDKEKRIMSDAPRGMEWGPKKTVWKGLRMITEKRMGDANQNDLRKRFPDYHVVGPLRKKVLEDAELMKKYPDAVEYYFSPKQKKIESQRSKHKDKTPMYGASRRTVEQHERYMAEVKEHNLLDADGNLNTAKLMNKLKSMVEDANSGKEEDLVNSVRHLIYRFLEQFTKDVEFGQSDLYRHARQKEFLQDLTDSVGEQVPNMHKKLMHEILRDEKAVNSISGEYEGTATTLEKLFKMRVYNIALKHLETNISGMVQLARKDPNWPDLEEYRRKWEKNDERIHRESIASRQRQMERRVQSKTPKKRPKHRGRRGKKYLTPAQRHNLRFKKSDWQNIIRGVV